jgi:hypothetical protein
VIVNVSVNVIVNVIVNVGVVADADADVYDRRGRRRSPLFSVLCPLSSLLPNPNHPPTALFFVNIDTTLSSSSLSSLVSPSSSAPNATKASKIAAHSSAEPRAMV